MAGMVEQGRGQGSRRSPPMWAVVTLLGIIGLTFAAMHNQAAPLASLAEGTSANAAEYGVAAVTMTARHRELVAQQTPALSLVPAGGTGGNIVGVAQVVATPTTQPAVAPTPTDTPRPTRWVLVTATVLNVRAGPSAADALIGQVRQDECLAMVLVGGGWYKLALADGQQGWSSGAFLAEVATCPPGSVVVMASAGVGIPAALTSTPVAAVAVATPTPPATRGAEANQGANLRAGPGTDYAMVGGIQAGSPVQVVARTSDGSWLKLGSGVWVAAFLVDNAPVVPETNDIPALPPTATAPPVSTATRAAPAVINSAPGVAYRVGAICRDGSSSGATGRGACSHHGGVSCWRMSDGGCR